MTRRPGESKIDDDCVTWAGYIAHSRARENGALVVLVDSNEQGVNTDDPLARVTLICDKHSTTMGFQSISRAKLFMPVPTQWCEQCRYAYEIKRGTHVHSWSSWSGEYVPGNYEQRDCDCGAFERRSPDKVTE